MRRSAKGLGWSPPWQNSAELEIRSCFPILFQSIRSSIKRMASAHNMNAPNHSHSLINFPAFSQSRQLKIKRSQHQPTLDMDHTSSNKKEKKQGAGQSGTISRTDPPAKMDLSNIVHTENQPLPNGNYSAEFRSGKERLGDVVSAKDFMIRRHTRMYCLHCDKNVSADHVVSFGFHSIFTFLTITTCY